MVNLLIFYKAETIPEKNYIYKKYSFVLDKTHKQP